MISHFLIHNLMRFEKLEIEFDSELNTIVGDNDSGKSTIVAALGMVLTGRFGGRNLESELSPHWFTHSVRDEWLTAIKADPTSAPPTILVEAYFRDSDDLAALKGKNNSLAVDLPGVRLDIHLDPESRPPIKRV